VGREATADSCWKESSWPYDREGDRRKIKIGEEKGCLPISWKVSHIFSSSREVGNHREKGGKKSPQGGKRKVAYAACSP